MASRPPPRFVVRRQDDAGIRRRHLWLAALWLASVLLTGLLTTWITRQSAPALIDQRQQRGLHAQVDAMKQLVANGQRDAQVNAVATQSLRTTLTQREDEISGLRANLGFYSRLVGADAQHAGVLLQGVKLEPIPASRGWNLTLSLVQNARRTDEITGAVTVAVEGLRGDKVVQLDWAALGDTTQQSGLPFRLMYFQQLHGTIVLPTDFRPMRLHISTQTAGDPAVVSTVAWKDALSGNVITTQGNQDVQP